MKLITLLFLISLFLFASFQTTFVGLECSGQYRLKYKGDTSCGGWPIDNKEELLTLNKDSTFVLELISQGGFEVYPDSGTWALTNSGLILKTKITASMIECDYVPKNRLFKIIKAGLVEPKCADKRLRRTLWKKE